MEHSLLLSQSVQEVHDFAREGSEAFPLFPAPIFIPAGRLEETWPSVGGGGCSNALPLSPGSLGPAK